MKIRMEINKCHWECECFNSDFSDEYNKSDLVEALAAKFLDLFVGDEEVLDNATVEEEDDEGL